MGKKLQLSIQEPCHENWDNMTAAEQGRFCASCQKQVVDFTGMSDAQLAAFFKRPSGGSTCGRFYADQLDRSIEMPKKRIPWIKYFFQFALPAFLASAKATAQGNIAEKKPEVCVSPSENVLKIGKVSVPRSEGSVKPYQRITIRGKVTDENKNPVPYASIMVKGSRQGASADSSGVFTIGIKFREGEQMVLEASSVGFKLEETIITQNADVSNELVIQLKRKVMSEVVLVQSYSSVKMGMYVGAVSVMRTSKQIPLVPSSQAKPSMIKVYPNPVQAGAS
ncbi:MAG: carboxypeptidase-like regulatory domain-containing protein, partial [Chitinophagaceae bacterium]|nr:carboxypeptidase-like regulatory domain-containing protein [Chitinophagaceae bacterium]